MGEVNKDFTYLESEPDSENRTTVTITNHSADNVPTNIVLERFSEEEMELIEKAKDRLRERGWSI